MPCPALILGDDCAICLWFAKDDDPMQVVGHHDVGCQLDAREMGRNVTPTRIDNPPYLAQYNPGAHDPPQQRPAVLHADCEEIGVRFRVVQ